MLNFNPFPDFNPFETCFPVIKNRFYKDRNFVHSCNDPKHPLLVACSQIISQVAANFFKYSIYMC